MPTVVTPERYASGRTFEEYLAYIASPENLQRTTMGDVPRPDNNAVFRTNYENTRLTDDQAAALKWLAAQPNGPAKILVLSEDWSSDCQRDIPTVARIAEATGMELRIFNRDGAHFSTAQTPSLAEAPDSNADIMLEFLNHKNGQSWQSIPVVAFYTNDLELLYHYIEYPALYDKDRLVMAHIRGPRPGETPEETAARGGKEFSELRASPFFRIWTGAAVDEMITMLHRKVVMGTV